VGERLTLREDRVSTPIGELIVLVDDPGRLRALDWADHQDRLHRLLRLHYGPDGFTLQPQRDPAGLSAAVGAYFDGEVESIAAVPVATGGTPFQRAVWTALRDVPCGTTVSYGVIARRIGRPSAVRAVGLANGANPVGIVVPCHRVVGGDGRLTGYAGGLERKRWLLAHEARWAGVRLSRSWSASGTAAARGADPRAGRDRPTLS
jgi:methylated-DNA-[protein]-cysteine S-methyltransferase